MTESRKVNLEVGVDANPAKEGFAEIGTAAKGMAQTVSQAGQTASKGFEGVGAGAAAAASKVEREEGRMIQAIQRKTASLEAAGKGQRAYQESILTMRGFDVAKFRPYLDQLDAAELKTKSATLANVGLAGSYGSVGSAAAAAAIRIAAMLGVASLGGIALMVRRVNDGVDALNDLKDATGASIENISALESVAKRTGGNFDTVSTSLIKFNQALATTEKPGSDAEKVLKAIGLSAKELRDMDPAQALLKTATALQGFADDGNKARAVQELFGKSLKEVAPFLKDLAEAGQLNATVTTKQAEEAEKFNKELYKMGAAAQDAARNVSGPLVTSVNVLIDRFRLGQKEGDGFIATLLKMGAISPAGIVAAGIRGAFGLSSGVKPSNGYTDTREELETLQRQLQGRRDRSSDIGVKSMLERERALQAQMAGYLNSTAGGGRGMGGYENLPRGSISLPPDLKTGKTGSAAKEIDPTATKEYRAAMAAAELRQKLRLKESDEIEKFFKDQEEAAKKAADAQIALARQVADAGNLARAQQIETLSKSNEQMRLENELIGKTQREIDALKLAREDEAIVAAERLLLRKREKEGYEGEYDSLQLLIDKMKEQRAVGAEGQVAREAVEAQKQIAEQWKNIDQVAHDTFVSIFDSGKNAFDRLRDTLKNGLYSLLYQMTVKKWLINITAGVSGTGVAQQAFGSQGSSLLSGGSSLLGMLGNSSMGAGLATGLSAWGGGVSGVTGALSAGAGLIGSGSFAGGASMIVGALGPIALGIGALVAITKGRGETRSGGQYSNQSLLEGPSGGEIGGDQVRQLVGTTIETINASILALGGTGQLTNLQSGLESSKNGKGFAYAGGTLSTGATFGQATQEAGRQSRRGDLTAEQAAAAFAEELQQATLQALVAADVPGQLGDYLSELGDIDKLTGGALSAAMKRVDAELERVKTIEAQRSQLEATLFDLTATDTERLAKVRELERAAIDPLNAALLEQVYAQQDLLAATEASTAAARELAANRSTYEQNFFSGEEKRMQTARSILDTVNAATGENMGVDAVLGASRDTFRQQVELAEKDTSEKGKKVYAALLSVAGAFASITEPAQQVAEVAQSYVDVGSAANDAANAARDSWLQTAKSIEDSMRKLRGELLGNKTDTFASAQGRFAIATAQARSGDQAAADSLPELVDVLQELALGTASTDIDYKRIVAATLASLEMTLGTIKPRAGLPSLDIGTSDVTRTGSALIHQGEAILPAQVAQRWRDTGGNQELVQAVDRMEARLAAIEKHASGTARSSDRLDKQTQEWSRTGVPVINQPGTVIA